ncbi:3'-5' exoribonuclease [Planomicrobium soli]|uniref:3'-5' exoribonuclease n=1 Tax=Planomicrobium soli TaxID=1176648 RepID=A0A2P8G9H6_9BACL|nr:3'-5' exoribonuclease YhaM [Planomicrobium soli]PSL30624.1 3'-5' exoribonuclease [Planomicrobium soli]
MTKGITQRAVGETIDEYLLIKQSVKGVTTTGNPFISLVLQDKSGDIEAKLWDTKEEQEKLFAAETIVRVGGEIHNYRGKNQLRIKSIRPAKPEENQSIADLMPSSEKSTDELSEEVMSYLFEMQNPQIQRITRHILKKYQQQFFTFPAATRNHHDYVSGLADHVVSMLQLGKALCGIYPTLNKDLLYAGIILHDIGKVFELSGPIATTYTVEGNLIGHISIMVTEISKTAEELEIDGEEVMLLQHLVLSHHGKEEWGSPKRPMIKEAEILHYIDNIDAKMMMLDRALGKTKPGEFSERLFALDNRSFYKPTI